MNQTLEFNPDLGDKRQFVIVSCTILIGTTAFPGYLLEAQECTSSELKQGLRCASKVCCVTGFELVYYPIIKRFTGVRSTFSNSNESSISLISISQLLILPYFHFKSHPISPEIVKNIQCNFNFHFSWTQVWPYTTMESEPFTHVVLTVFLGTFLRY